MICRKKLPHALRRAFNLWILVHDWTNDSVLYSVPNNDALFVVIHSDCHAGAANEPLLLEA